MLAIYFAVRIYFRFTIFTIFTTLKQFREQIKFGHFSFSIDEISFILSAFHRTLSHEVWRNTLKIHLNFLRENVLQNISIKLTFDRSAN